MQYSPQAWHLSSFITRGQYTTWLKDGTPQKITEDRFKTAWCKCNWIGCAENCQSFDSTRTSHCQSVDNDCLLANKSGYHSAKHLRETVLQITKDLTDEKVFDLQPGRKYQCFKKFKVDLLSKLDHREFFKWARRLFKVWEPMYYTAQED